MSLVGFVYVQRWPVRRFWEPFSGHAGPVRSLAIGRLGSRAVVVSAGDDGTVRMWDAATARPPPISARQRRRHRLHLGIWPPTGLRGHAGPVRSVAIGRSHGRAVVVSAGDDAAIRLWDAVTGRAAGPPLLGHEGPVSSVAVWRIDGRDVVSGGVDATVRVWDLGTRKPCGDPLLGHGKRVLCVAARRLDGRDVVVSGGRDKTVRVWDMRTGEPYGDPFVGHDKRVLCVAAGRLDGRDVIVSGSLDRTVRMLGSGLRAERIIDLQEPAAALALHRGG